MNRIRIAIRDDDVNFFTNPSDLERIYDRIKGFPVSYAVIPNVVEAGACPDIIKDGEAHSIGDNKELCLYLKQKFASGNCDILMHGITHEYKYSRNRKVSEMIWRINEGKDPLIRKLEEAKQILENALGVPIVCFVAPHNDINQKGLDSLPSGMNYSGIIALSFNRSLNVISFNNYVKRFWCRLKYRVPYPGVLDYHTHKELNACTGRSFDYLKRVYDYCKSNGYPMAINVHYWHIRDYPDKYLDFFNFINYAVQDGAIPSRMRDCF